MTTRDLWIPVYVGLGSNLDDPEQQVREALRELSSLPATRLIRSSRLYRNPPMGPVDQPDYVNAVAHLLTSLTARELLAELQRLERRHGRVRQDADRWGPRRLDLDLLTYGSSTIDEPGLQVPHPGIRERNFVLFPLLEIAPALEIPGLGAVTELAAALDDADLSPIE